MEFDDLREQFLEIDETCPDPDKAIRQIGSMAARRFKRLADAGTPGIFQKGFAFPPPKRLGDHDGELWWLSWKQLCHCLAQWFPDRLPSDCDFGAATVVQTSTGVTQITYDPKWWKQRARDHASACKLLDDLLAAVEKSAERTGGNKSTITGWMQRQDIRNHFPDLQLKAFEAMMKRLDRRGENDTSIRRELPTGDASRPRYEYAAAAVEHERKTA